MQFSFSFLSRELHHAVKNEYHRSPDGYKATEILAAVNKLGINDENKSKIVASGALSGYVALLGSSCTTEEQFLSAQGLWTLASKCQDDVCKQENCVTGGSGCLTVVCVFVSSILCPVSVSQFIKRKEPSMAATCLTVNYTFHWLFVIRGPLC